jgi:hypothetical protein
VQTASVLGSAAIDTAAPSNDNWEENWNLQSDDSATVNQGLLESLENDLGVNDLGVQGDYDRAA